MSMSTQYEPSSDDEPYRDPLLDWVGREILVDWAGRKVRGVVVDIELDHDDHHFDERLIVSTGADATIAIAPDNVLASLE